MHHADPTIVQVHKIVCAVKCTRRNGCDEIGVQAANGVSHAVLISIESNAIQSLEAGKSLEHLGGNDDDQVLRQYPVYLVITCVLCISMTLSYSDLS